jgi:hypothetical protein
MLSAEKNQNLMYTDLNNKKTCCLKNQSSLE